MWLAVSLFSALAAVGRGSSSPELGAEVQAAAGLPSFGDGGDGGFVSDGSTVAIYSIEWSTSTDGCSGKQLPMGAVCPVGAILMHPAPDGCTQVDDATVRCDKSPPSPSPSSSPVYVACYAPAGFTTQDLLITAVFPEHPFYCDKKLREVGGFFPTVYRGGSASNSAQLSNKCGNGMNALLSDRSRDNCEARHSCNTISGISCSGSKACYSTVPRMELLAYESDDICVEEFTTSSANGASCEYGATCSSGICIGGVCRDGYLDGGSTGCTLDQDCLSRKCALNEDNVLHCCKAFDVAETAHIGESRYCANNDGIPVICASSSSSLSSLTSRFQAEDAVNLNSASEDCCTVTDVPSVADGLGYVMLEPNQATGGIAVAYFDSGDYLAFGPIDFGSDGGAGCVKVVLSYSRGDRVFAQSGNAIVAATDAAALELRLDDPEGDLVGEFSPTITGSWASYEEGELFALVSGEHTMYFVGKGERGVLNLDWIEVYLPGGSAPVNEASDLPVICASSSLSSLKSRFQAEDAVNLNSASEDCCTVTDVPSVADGLGYVMLEPNQATGGIAVAYFDSGDYLAFGPIDFGSDGAGCVKVVLSYSRGDRVFAQSGNAIVAATDAAALELRLDDPEGDLVGEFSPTITGSWASYEEGEVLARVSGEHTLYFVGKGERGVLNLDWIEVYLPDGS